MIVVSTSVAIDLNTRRNKHMICETDKKYKYLYDHSYGYYIGFKLILAISQDSQILGFEINKNSYHDSKLLISFVQKLIRSRIIKPGDILICDKILPRNRTIKSLSIVFMLFRSSITRETPISIRLLKI